MDFVIEHDGQLVGIEVKPGTRPRVGDIVHLRTFRDEYRDAVRGCLLLHGGDRLEWLAPGILAAPWWRVL